VNTVFHAENGLGISVPSLCGIARGLGVSVDALTTVAQDVVGFSACQQKAVRVVCGTEEILNPSLARPASPTTVGTWHR
jgi:hypothetical protein